MATIVLVHGIAHEQLSADTLESQWLPALAGGVRNSGDAALADRLWRHGKPGDIDVRMAYYGNKYLKEGAQGTNQTSHLEAAALDLAEQLAETWLRTAAQYADDDRDQREAANQLRALKRDDDGAQGTKAASRAQRPCTTALVRPTRRGDGRQVGRALFALRTVVYDRLRPRPSHVSPTVTRWDNLVDRDDLVAAHLDLAPYFPPPPDRPSPR